MGAHAVSWLALLCAFFLFIIPLVLNHLWKLGLLKETAIAVVRMTGQLILIALFIEYLFELNNRLVNICWIIIMMIFAATTVVNSCNLKKSVFFIPMILVLVTSVFVVLLYMNIFVIDGYEFFDVKYLVVIGGMLLGNSLKGAIIGLNNFYSNITQTESQYLYRLSIGATRQEALMPYIQSAMRAALRPTIATAATMGIVFLPGMMTGQILGGSAPLLAIKYQIMIMIAIYLVITMSMTLGIVFSIRLSFNEYDILKHTIFVKAYGKKK